MEQIKQKKISSLLASESPLSGVRVEGWVRTKRDAKDFSFIELNDGSCLSNLQVIAPSGIPRYEEIKKLTTGSSVSITGDLVPSPGKGQKWEINAKDIHVYQYAPEDYPLQKKRHTDEFLRTIAHLRPRTNKYGAAFRIRSGLSYAVHHFFRERGFVYIHSPIITPSDCEGAGELFRVTTHGPMLSEDNQADADFFGKPAYLTVSGQLLAEMMALALKEVYTFGPTFRAENSNTRRHAAEFWMIEPEMAFCSLSGNMDLAEDFVRFLVNFTMTECKEDFALFAKFVDTSLPAKMKNILENRFVRITYAEAIDILSSSKEKFQYLPRYGSDLQTEHERYLTQTHFQKPVIVIDYPKSIKPFYMRVNEDGETVAAMDVLVPGIGEIIGGSQREERLDMLAMRMEETGLSPEDYKWYLDSRKYGSVAHSGFGLGFERLIMMVTGISNIRDVIPFPRTPGSIDF